jgi:NhaP-type Na+/H+ or K+/H+ antiporter
VIAGGTAAALLLFRIPFSQALLLGAVLASTDPIVLRDVVRNEAIPRSVRRTLTIEAGTNDIIVLPIVLILIAAGQPNGDGLGYWVGFLLRLLVLSPLVGLAVGGVGAWVMGKADARYNIRREYQALYGIGLVLASYSLAQAVGGDGFLAAFFAGLAVAVFDVTLCDCFMDYGEVSAEMAMLLAFILFGAVLSPLFATIPLGLALLFAAIVIGVVRPLALELVLARARMSRAARAFIGWFGPRGLSALLLALLAVEARVPNAVRLLAVTGVVALVSVLVHGATATPVSQWYERMLARRTRAEEREASAGGLFRKAASEVPRVSVDELARELEGANPPTVLDVRTRAEYDQSAGSIPGSVRILPDQVLEWAARIPHDRRVVAYCT